MLDKLLVKEKEQAEFFAIKALENKDPEFWVAQLLAFTQETVKLSPAEKVEFLIAVLADENLIRRLTAFKFLERVEQTNEECL